METKIDNNYKINYIRDILKKFNIKLFTLTEQQLFYIFELFHYNYYIKIDDNLVNMYYGVYYQVVLPDYKSMIHHYEISSKTIPYTYFLLGFYYKSMKKYNDMKKNYELCKKYNVIDGINDYGMYYKLVERNLEKSKELFSIGVSLNSVDSYLYMAFHYHYEKEEENVDKMIYYYQKAMKMNSTEAMCNLGNYYLSIGEYELMMDCYNNAIRFGDYDGILGLSAYYFIMGNYNTALLNYIYIMKLGDENKKTIRENTINIATQNFTNLLLNLETYDKLNEDTTEKIFNYIAEIKNFKLFFDIMNIFSITEKNINNVKKIIDIAYKNGVVGWNKIKVDTKIQLSKLRDYKDDIDIDFNFLIKSYFDGTQQTGFDDNFDLVLRKIQYHKDFNTIMSCCVCCEDKICIPTSCYHFMCDICYMHVYNKFNNCPICRKEGVYF